MIDSRMPLKETDDKPVFILIGNYPPDKQQSMERFALMLKDGFELEGNYTEIWRPTTFFVSKNASSNAGFRKWLGYIDKWIVFPFVITVKLFSAKYKSKSVRFHICDHSNAPYINYFPKARTSITCHDVLAIRGALGYKDAYCTSNTTGKILQQWILRNLIKFELIICVSNFTLTQLRELAQTKKVSGKNWVVIHNGFNAPFEPMNKAAARELLAKSGVPVDKPFLFTVGSNLERKNRKLLIDMLAHLKDNWSGNVLFAGKEASAELLEQARQKHVEDRVFNVVSPSHAVLVALYSNCDAFIFPSFSEGFGWPLIEAQACGCLVIASDIAPLQEIGGGAAIHLNPSNAGDFAKAFLDINSNFELKQHLINAGLQNSKHYKIEAIIKQYLILLQKA